MTEDHMPTDLAALLAEHSPRLIIERPALVPSPGSPTGWLLVVPSIDIQRLSEEAQ